MTGLIYDRVHYLSRGGPEFLTHGTDLTGNPGLVIAVTPPIHVSSFDLTILT